MFYLNNDYNTPLRYDMAKFLEYNIDNYDIMTSYLVNNLKKIPYVGEYMVTSEEYKPDLLSYNIYGNTQYWWIIMAYNDIHEISKLTLGTMIKYPSIDGLESMYFSLASLQGAN